MGLIDTARNMRGIMPGSSLKHKAVTTQNVLTAERTLPMLRTSGQPAPFLGLKSRLSQIWLNRWTVLLILVLIRVLILLSGLNQNIGDAKVKALAACTKVEDIGSAMASMPHYLSVGVNKMTVEGFDAAIRGMITVLNLILTGVESIIYFVINFYVGTYVCLITAFIHGAFDVGIGAAKGAGDLMNKAIGTITETMSNEIKNFEGAVNDVMKTVNDATSFFGGGGKTVPTLNIGGRFDELRNIKIDTSDFVKTLTTVKDNTPTFDDVQEVAKKAIAIPFDLVRKELNESSQSWGIPRDIFPVAQKQALSFCSDNSAINDFFNGLWKISDNAKIAFLVVIPILAILVCIPMAKLEIRRYREQKALALEINGAVASAAKVKQGEAQFDAMDVIYQASRPKSSRIGLWFSSKFGDSKRQYIARWAWAYCTSLPAMFILSLAIAGLFSCFCQWVVLEAVKKEAPALVEKVGDFAEDVVRTLEGVSTRWATDANSVILKYNSDVNDDVLGKVRQATGAVNNTLVTFNNEMNKRIDSVFAGTVLHDTVKNVVRCIIGLKIEAVSDGMNWVHEHARVSFPLFPNDTFSAGASDSVSGDSQLTSFLASPSSVTTDEITQAVNHVIDFLRNGLIQDALISTGLLLVYVILVLVGVIRALLNISGPVKQRGDGAGLRGKHFVDEEPSREPSRDDNPFEDDQYRQNDTFEMRQGVATSGGYSEKQREYYAGTGNKNGWNREIPAPTYQADGGKF